MIQSHQFTIVPRSGYSRSSRFPLGDPPPPPPVEEWQLAEGHYVPAKMVPNIIHPRPPAETLSYERHRLAPAGHPWSIPIAVQGGAWPFKYSIVTAPSGVYMDETLVEVDGLQVRPENYGVLCWDSPTVGTHTIRVRVETQDYNRQPEGRSDADWGYKEIEWSLVVADADNTTHFVWCSGDGNDTTGDGTKTNPFRTMTHVYDSGSYNLRQLHLLAGTYNTDSTVGGFDNGTNKPIMIVGISKDLVTINMTRRVMAVSRNGGFFSGFTTVENGQGEFTSNQRIHFISGSVSRSVFFRVTYTNPSNGTVGDDNPTAIFGEGGTINPKRYTTIHSCRETGRTGTGNSAPLFVLFSCNDFLSENNYTSGAGSYPMYLKNSTAYCTQRDNTVESLAESYSLSTGCLFTYLTEYVEFTWSRVLREVRFNVENTSTYGVHWAYRNSFLTGLVIRSPSAADQGPINVEKNAVHGTITSGTNVNSSDAECVASSGVMDGFALTGSYRTNWLGKRGAEIV